MISDSEKSQIRMLLQQPQWRTIESVAEEKIKQIGEEKSSKDTEWESIKTLLKSEGKIEGIREFIRELYNLAQ